MKTNPYIVKLPSIGLRSPEHEVFARDPAVRREIAMIPIRVGDEATLKASGLRFRIVTVDEFSQHVEIQLLRNGERAWIPYAELQGEAFEQSSIAFPGKTPLSAATERPIPDAGAPLYRRPQVDPGCSQGGLRSARATRSPASDGPVVNSHGCRHYSRSMKPSRLRERPVWRILRTALASI